MQDARSFLDNNPAPGQVWRTLFISDIHLGTKACQAEALLDFLKDHDAETICLVGDIIDFWRVRRGAVWPQSHNDVLQKILRKVRKGARVIFIPGNHDEALRDYCGMAFGGIEIHRDFVHVSADGSRFLVLHGDEFDVVVRYARWLAFLGDRSYEFALWCNHPLNWLRRRFGFGYWSLSAYLKLRVKSAVNFIGEFENAIVEEAGKRDADGVICGHIHHATDRMIEGIRYINCGDWVESHTAIAEDHDGSFQLIRWRERLMDSASDHDGEAADTAGGVIPSFAELDTSKLAKRGCAPGLMRGKASSECLTLTINVRGALERDGV
jgi:UDP-2,3-diacylglucosamine pyrophosphatase LpxH